MPKLAADDLKKILELLFDEMLTKGILPPDVANRKEEIINQIVDNLNDVDIQKENLRDTKAQKALCLAIISEVVANKEMEMNPGKKTQLRFDYVKPFKETNAETLRKELTEKLTIMLTFIDTLTRKPGDPIPNIRQDAEEIAAKLARDFKFESNDREAKQIEIENKNDLDVSGEGLLTLLYVLTGHTHNGITPRVTYLGSVVNLMGFANHEPPSDNSFMGKVQKDQFENLGISGDKSTTIIDDLALGMAEAVENVLHKPLTPFDISSPRPNK